jgi:murein DD-endopeptidase MepM/ murein hydrolase activator NlpD
MQLAGYLGIATVVGWAAIASAIVVMDSIGAGNYRDQAQRQQTVYQERLNAIAGERDIRAAEALAAQDRFNAALAQISVMQNELLTSETRRRELETGLDVVQATLRDAMARRDAAEREVAARRAAEDTPLPLPDLETSHQPVTVLAETLARTAEERDAVLTDARSALAARDELELEIRLMRDQNDQIFRQLEDAMALSVEPLDKMFRRAGLPTDRIIEEIRRGYSGQGGPLTPISFSTRGNEPSADEIRANAILNHLDQVNLYRLAAEKAPFASPVTAAVRFTSSFGSRRDPRTGGRRMHNGVDFAGAHGTNIYATADGIVTFAGLAIRLRPTGPDPTRIRNRDDVRTQHKVARAQGSKGLARGSHS